jgi:RNA polymerase sigma-70 factor, ECF subfamily
MAGIDETIRRFLDGDEDAFSQIVRSWEKKIFSLAWRMLGNREDAQDVVQETFISVFKSIRGLRDTARFSTWLYRIALNHCRLQRRSRYHDISCEQMVDQIGDEDSFPSDFRAEDRGSVSREVEALETIDIIRKALAGLSEDHRAAIILKEYIGLSLEEIAGVMGCPLSTAKSRLYHGLQNVQQTLKRMGVKT